MAEPKSRLEQLEDEKRITQDLQKIIERLYIMARGSRGEHIMTNNFQGVELMKLYQYLNISSFKDDIATNFLSLLSDDDCDLYFSLKAEMLIISGKIESALTEELSKLETNPTSNSVNKQLKIDGSPDLNDPNWKGKTPNLNLVNQQSEEKPLESSFDMHSNLNSDRSDPQIQSNKGMECFTTQTGTSKKNGILTNSQGNLTAYELWEQELNRERSQSITRDIEKIIDKIYIVLKASRGEVINSVIHDFQGLGRQKIYQCLNIKSFNDDIAPSFLSVLSEEECERYFALKSEFQIISNKEGSRLQPTSSVLTRPDLGCPKIETSSSSSKQEGNNSTLESNDKQLLVSGNGLLTGPTGDNKIVAPN